MTLRQTSSAFLPYGRTLESSQSGPKWDDTGSRVCPDLSIMEALFDPDRGLGPIGEGQQTSHRHHLLLPRRGDAARSCRSLPPHLIRGFSPSVSSCRKWRLTSTNVFQRLSASAAVFRWSVAPAWPQERSLARVSDCHAPLDRHREFMRSDCCRFEGRGVELPGYVGGRR